MTVISHCLTLFLVVFFFFFWLVFLFMAVAHPQKDTRGDVIYPHTHTQHRHADAQLEDDDGAGNWKVSWKYCL